MDILSEILQLAGIEHTILAHHSIYKPWAIQFPCDRSIGFHAVTQGELFIRSPHFKNPIHLQKGDIFLAARGFTHDVSTDPKLKAQKTIQIGDRFLEVSGQMPLVTFASGAFRLHDNPIHSLLKELPDQILLRSSNIPSHDPLHSALQLLSAELSLNQMASSAITHNLLNVLFHYILRNWLNSDQGQNHRWHSAIKDVHLIQALKAIHEKPEYDWSVEQLASVSGLSRAAFAAKFKRLTSDSPAHYLAKIRIQKASKIFRASTHNVEEVAAAVGYDDPFVFSKVFKRIQGVSPRDYRNALAKPG